MKGSKSYKVLVRTVPDLFERAKPRFRILDNLYGYYITGCGGGVEDLLPRWSPEELKEELDRPEWKQKSRWVPILDDDEQIGWKCIVHKYASTFQYYGQGPWRKIHYADFVLEYYFPKEENA